MRIAAFVTSHGFGHAAHASAVIDALHERRPDLAVDVFTEVPSTFLRSSLRAPHHRVPCATDVGMVQRGPFHADLDTTAVAATTFLDGLYQAAEAAAWLLIERACTAALYDISPLGIRAAARAGIPSVLVENFRWDWIYAELDPAPAALPEASWRLGEIYRTPDLYVQVAPGCDPAARGVRADLPVARAARAKRDATRKDLRLGSADTVVLVTTGGVSGELPFLDALRARRDVTFVVTGAERSSRDGNVVRIAADAPLYLPDLIRASDAVVAKRSSIPRCRLGSRRPSGRSRPGT